jgi:ferric-dicitrate binding protein FerR (iron transport regulator)
MSEVGDLIRLAGRRPMPDEAQMSAAREAARAEWTRAARQRRWRLSWWSLAAAASVAIAGSGVVWFNTRTSTPIIPVPATRAEIATVQIVSGTLAVIAPDGVRHPVTQSGSLLRQGDRVETSDGSRAAMVLNSGLSVRIDRATSARLEGPELVTLDRGAVYVDSGTQPHRDAVRIQTRFGTVSHVGTQFEVRLDANALHVRVREGTVTLAREREQWTSRAGEALRLTQGGVAERQSIATFGSDWDWIGELAPPFTLEGAPLPRFLDWASRELGMQWEYADPRMRDRFDRIVLHGSLQALTPDEALVAVLPTCGLTSVRKDGRIIVLNL